MEQRHPGMMVLVSLGIITAYLYSAISTFVFKDMMDYYFELATSIAMMLLGHIMEMKTKQQASADTDNL